MLNGILFVISYGSNAVAFYFKEDKMFCRNCGKEIKSSDKFCFGCGSGTADEIKQPHSQYQHETNDEILAQKQDIIEEKPVYKRDNYFYGTVITSAVLIVLLLLRWIRIPLLNVLSLRGMKSEYSLFEWVSGISRLSDTYGGMSGALGLCGIIAAVCGICIVLLTFFIWKLFNDIDGNGTVGIGSLAFILSAVLAVAVILVTSAINSEIYNQTYGMFDKLFELTLFPYVVIVGALTAKFMFLRKVEDDLEKLNILNTKAEAVKNENDIDELALDNKIFPSDAKKLKEEYSLVKIGETIKFGKYMWQVLSIEEDNILVISKSIIANGIYDSDNAYWKNSAIRVFLNYNFYNKEFNEEEKSLISNEIFLLKIDEVNKYFINDSSRIAYDGQSASWWWLSSLGGSNKADCIYADGSIGSHNVHRSGGVRPAIWLNLK